MELTEAVRRRRMVRRYDPDRPVPRGTLLALLDLATRAPSAGASQGRHLVVLDERVDVDRFWASTAPPGPPDAWLRGMRTAPVVVLVLSDPGAYAVRYARPDKVRSTLRTDGPEAAAVAGWPVPWWDVDAGMAALLVLLGAVDAGLGGCLVGVPAGREAAVRAAFDVPDALRLVGAVTLGHAAPDVPTGATPGRAPRTRRGVDDVVSWSRYRPGGPARAPGPAGSPGAAP